MKLLIADDDRVLTQLLSSKLRAKGWTVTIALDAMQAVMFAMRTEPDVILLDINMPGGTGIEALRKLKASMKTSQIPVVILTGSISPDDEPTVRELGAEGYIKKPAELDQLHELLARLAS
jgi:CheY-like chemotaxis protein